MTNLELDLHHIRLIAAGALLQFQAERFAENMKRFANDFKVAAEILINQKLPS